jgi:hypothetical protein
MSGQAKLSDRLRGAGSALAGMITAEEFEGAPADGLFALRRLSIELLAFADDAAGLEAAARPPSPRELSSVVRHRPAAALLIDNTCTACTPGTVWPPQRP